MNRYHILARLELGVGTMLALSDKQAAPRMHLLERTEAEGVYVAKDRIEFKAGETIGCDGELPKAKADLVMPADGSSSPPALTRRAARSKAAIAPSPGAEA